MAGDWTITDFDREIWAEELNDFVPDTVFDAHTHIWDDNCAGSCTSYMSMRLDVGYDTLRQWNQEIFPGRKLGFLLLGTPIPGLDIQAFHAFAAAEAAKNPLHLCSTSIIPQTTPEELDEVIRKYHFTGLKPYRLHTADPANCRITDYLPEAQLEVADQHRLVITLHMSRFDGIGDRVNRDDLRYLTKRYPNVRWILAHCARSFNPFTLEKSIFELRDIPNIWYDTSAVCSAHSQYLLLKYENIDRILFGTDNIAAGGDHGKYVTWGKGWCFMAPSEQPHCRSEATLVVYEQLRAQKEAADMAGITGDQVKDIFYRNAAKLFGFNWKQIQ